MINEPWFYDGQNQLLRFQELECMDSNLKEVKMNEFKELENFLNFHLAQLNKRYQHLLERPFEGIYENQKEQYQFTESITKETEVLKFGLFYEMYHKSTENATKHHELFLDRLKQENKGFNNTKIIEMEKNYLSYLSYKHQKRAIKYWFKKIRQGFMIETKNLFQETDLIILEHQKRIQEFEKHLDHTEKNHEKLYEWRNLKIAQIQQQHEKELENQKKLMAEKMAQEKKELELRSKKKSLIQEYHKMKKETQLKEEKLRNEIAEQRHLENLQLFQVIFVG